jgi:hypothetical protein
MHVFPFDQNLSAHAIIGATASLASGCRRSGPATLLFPIF